MSETGEKGGHCRFLVYFRTLWSYSGFNTDSAPWSDLLLGETRLGQGNQMCDWGLHGSRGGCPPWHPSTCSPCLSGSVQWDLVLCGVSNKADMFSLHPYAARKFLLRSEKGKASAGMGGGHGCREQRVETNVFKSAEQSVPGRSNFEIRALGSILFYFL